MLIKTLLLYNKCLAIWHKTHTWDKTSYIKRRLRNTNVFFRLIVNRLVKCSSIIQFSSSMSMKKGGVQELQQFTL